MSNDSGARIPQRPADPWQALADAHLDHDREAALGAFASLRTRLRARWLFALDAVLLALQAERELSAATMAQLAEYAGEGTR
jgi:hypothetical protein